jgi:hypothetical protein
VTNTQAYFDKKLIMASKIYIIQAHGFKINTLTSVNIVVEHSILLSKNAGSYPATVTRGLHYKFFRSVTFAVS